MTIPFADWVQLPDTKKIYTVDITLAHIVTGSVVTVDLHLSTHPVIFSEIFYEPCINGLPRFTSEIQEMTEGKPMASWGELEINNTEGQFDTYLTGYAWDNRPVVIKVGGPELTFANYKTLLTGVMGMPTWDDQKITVPVYDKKWILSTAMAPTAVFDTTAYPNISSEDAGKPIPELWGNAVTRITPVCINQYNKSEYKISGRALTTILGVYDDGVPGYVSFTPHLSDGEFDTIVTPTGNITCLAVGTCVTLVGGVYKALLGDCISDVLQTFGGLTSGEIDATTLATFNTDCPYHTFYYLTEQKDVLTIIDEMIQGCNAFHRFDRDGVFQISLFDAPAGSPDLTIIGDSEIISFDGVEPIPDIYYQGVIASNYNWISKTWLSRNFFTDSTIKDLNLSAKDKGEIQTLLSNTSTDPVATQFLDLWGTPRFKYSLTMKLQPLQFSLYSVVSLTRNRFGLSSSLFLIISIEEDYTNNTVKLVLFK